MPGSGRASIGNQLEYIFACSIGLDALISFPVPVLNYIRIHEFLIRQWRKLLASVCMYERCTGMNSTRRYRIAYILYYSVNYYTIFTTLSPLSSLRSWSLIPICLFVRAPPHLPLCNSYSMWQKKFNCFVWYKHQVFERKIETDKVSDLYIAHSYVSCLLFS